jgi:DNA-binding NtrC family response regulator
MIDLREKSVLIIDDDTAMLRALEKVLSGEGAAVTRLERAADALETLAVRKEKTDLVITDLRMPFVSGITLVNAIHGAFPGLPIIVLTAFGSPYVRSECMRLGAAAFLEKPLNTPQLLDAIERAMSPQAKTGLHLSRPGTLPPK